MELAVTEWKITAIIKLYKFLSQKGAHICAPFFIFVPPQRHTANKIFESFKQYSVSSFCENLFIVAKKLKTNIRFVIFHAGQT